MRPRENSLLKKLFLYRLRKLFLGRLYETISNLPETKRVIVILVLRAMLRPVQYSALFVSIVLVEIILPSNSRRYHNDSYSPAISRKRVLRGEVYI